MAYAFDERFDASPRQPIEDELSSDRAAAPQRDPLSRAGSEQGPPIQSKNPFWKKGSSYSPIPFRNPFRKDSSSSSVPQIPSSKKSRVPLPPGGDSSSPISSRQQSSNLAKIFEEGAEFNVPYYD